jgi:phosphatidylglycerol:prolipoprotein diacylglycerol transferase
MYATIYHAVYDIFGVQLPGLMLVQSFGFFVAIAFLACAYVFARELNRREAKVLTVRKHRKVELGKKPGFGDVFGTALFGFLLGFKFMGMSGEMPEDFSPQSFMFSLEGSWITGFVMAALFGGIHWWILNRKTLPEPKTIVEAVKPSEHVANMTLIAGLFGFLGAKIFHVLENIPSFTGENGGDRLSDTLFSFSGLTMYGGLILGSIAVLVYARRHKMRLLHVMDACAPGLMLAYGIGRIGCHVSGDGDWGIVNTDPMPGWLSFLPDWMWAYDYPNNVNQVCNPWPGYDPHYAETLCNFSETPHLVLPVFPTPLYEAIMCISIFFVLWRIRKKFAVPGLLFSIYLVFNGTERFFIELIRQNEILFHIGSWGVTQAEMIAFGLVLTGVAGIWWTRKRFASQPEEAAPVDEAPQTANA